MKRSYVRWNSFCAALCICAVLLQPASADTVRASLRPASGRKQAPSFNLQNESGQAIRLSDHRGKIVLLNFWATACGGCRLELPSFVQIDYAFKSKAVVVVGISTDVSYESLKNAQEGWSRVKPFIQTHDIRYTIVMGDDAVSNAYGIEALPVTYLIDARGRMAASYVGIVDKQNLEGNIKMLLSER